MVNTKFINSLASEFKLGMEWQLRAVAAFAIAAPELRSHIRAGISDKSEQVDSLNVLMREAFDGRDAAESGSGSWTAADTKLYNNVAVFVPGYETPYAKLNFKHVTKKQLVKQMEREHYFRVVKVAEQPSQPLALEKCAADFVDINKLQLQDDVKLAVVVGGEHALSKLTRQVETIQGWTEGQIRKDENEAAEWALVHIAGDTGASRWCFNMLTGLVDGEKMQIEIDGMAFSQERALLVERKPRIMLIYVKELANKVFLMADGCCDDPGEAAACAVCMEEEGIAPVLPTGDGGYAARDSCGRWPVDDGTRRRGQNFLANIKPGRRRPNKSDSSAATADASRSSGAGKAAGPHSAVGIGRHASSSQQAACSPAHPAHHLRTHDPFSATSGAWLQRRVAPVCRPPAVPAPLQHAQRAQAVAAARRL
ncbi:hypothetical protein HXX76_003000 [Chlamydomonas incerta]|uniref:Uncharacterized protein n=1 Tax=Chlamydomonas incerta TaxID=51695 RepID=A0A835TLQ8_CHLIN|nr:hypothetical protein HXX76_003000 [Chlamydomonas incerta]|eukprot:KAG2442924.1 hypothetical protein HXX76_003000 [Chlamydomonas incerta]